MKKIIAFTLLMFAMMVITNNPTFAAPPNPDHPISYVESTDASSLFPFMKIEAQDVSGIYFPSFNKEKFYCLTTIYSENYSPQNLTQIKNILNNKYQQVAGSNYRWKSKNSNIYIETKVIKNKIQVMYHLRT